MKLAVSFDMDSDNIARDFDGTLFFKMYDIDDGEVIDALLCGEISQEAEKTLGDEGISFYSGFDGNADDIVQGFISGIYHFE